MIGKRIGTYQLVRQIGKGGMGAVYEAVHVNIGQRAAVKVLDPELSRKQQQVQRFFDEARAIGMVQHPGLVRLFDFNRLEDGTVYILMELLQGESLWGRYLRFRAQGGWFGLADALRITRQIASALAAVHQQGIIHRDLKPENIFLVPDPEAAGGERTKILDFGIAKIAEPQGISGTRRTTMGQTLGTPIYMSPEQCRGTESITEKTDVYALGVLLYELLARRPPFDSAEGGMVLGMHIFQEPPPLARLTAGVPAAVSQLVHDMLAKEPERRPTMAEVMARLLQLQSSGEIPPISQERSGLLDAALMTAALRQQGALPPAAGPAQAPPAAGPAQVETRELPQTAKPATVQMSAPRRRTLTALLGLALLLGGAGVAYRYKARARLRPLPTTPTAPAPAEAPPPPPEPPAAPPPGAAPTSMTEDEPPARHHLKGKRHGQKVRSHKYTDGHKVRGKARVDPGF